MCLEKKHILVFMACDRNNGVISVLKLQNVVQKPFKMFRKKKKILDTFEAFLCFFSVWYWSVYQ